MNAGPIPVEISARHVHLSTADAINLFGGLCAHKPLSLSRAVSGHPTCVSSAPRASWTTWPCWAQSDVSQVEISKTDARALGINPPVRQSGDTAGSPGIILASATGIVGLESGVIVASRHIHMHTDDAARFGLKDKDMVDVRLDTERPVILENVLVRVSPDFKLAMHIDADEGNSAGWKPGATGVVIALHRS